MTSVSVTITGVLWDHAAKAGRPVTLSGEASYSGLSVGGGPIIPDVPPGYPTHPWVPPPGTPTHPIAGPPGTPTFPIWGPPGFNPPGSGYPPGVGGGPIMPPSPPGSIWLPIWGPPGIDLPPVPGYPPVAGHPLPPEGSPPERGPIFEVKSAWTPAQGWFVVLVPSGGEAVVTPSSAAAPKA